MGAKTQESPPLLSENVPSGAFSVHRREVYISGKHRDHDLQMCFPRPRKRNNRADQTGHEENRRLPDLVHERVWRQNGVIALSLAANRDLDFGTEWRPDLSSKTGVCRTAIWSRRSNGMECSVGGNKNKQYSLVNRGMRNVELEIRCLSLMDMLIDG